MPHQRRFLQDALLTLSVSSLALIMLEGIRNPHIARPQVALPPVVRHEEPSRQMHPRPVDAPETEHLWRSRDVVAHDSLDWDHPQRKASPTFAPQTIALKIHQH